MPDSHLNFGYLRFWLQLKQFETATVLTQSKAYPKHYTQSALYHKHFPPACTEVQASHLKLNLPRDGVLQTASLSCFSRWKVASVVTLRRSLTCYWRKHITPYTHAGLRLQQTCYVAVHTPCLGLRLEKTRAYQTKLQNFTYTNYTTNFSISSIIQLFPIFTALLLSSNSKIYTDLFRLALNK
jgi:hypothetical protein